MWFTDKDYDIEAYRQTRNTIERLTTTGCNALGGLAEGVKYFHTKGMLEQ